MESNFIDTLLGRNSKADTMYQLAMKATQSISNLIKLDSECTKDIEVDKSRFHKIFNNDPKSPSILWFSENEYIIYYPPYSTPYEHSYENQCKFVEVLKGIIFDKNSDRKFFKGDKAKVHPSDNYVPYTDSQEAYLRVCVGNCDSIWDNVCK